MQNLQWRMLHFDELSTHQLYAMLRLRSEVFVVEQQCVFLDMDNIDQHCHHLLSYSNNELVACTRLVPPGRVYVETPSIGRVVTAPGMRGQKIGRLLMQKSIEAVRQLHGNSNIKIGAQMYLENFYSSLGFVRCGDAYDEDGIDHIPMLLASM